MNLITKLLMENRVTVQGYEYSTRLDGQHDMSELVISIYLPKTGEFPNTKEELLKEVPNTIYVSEMEWMLLNYWLRNGVEEITKDEQGDIFLCSDLTSEDGEIYYQGWSEEKLFNFLEVNENYALDDLISQLAIIEG